jgi:hypothetical protein
MAFSFLFRTRAALSQFSLSQHAIIIVIVVVSVVVIIVIPSQPLIAESNNVF